MSKHCQHCGSTMTKTLPLGDLIGQNSEYLHEPSPKELAAAHNKAGFAVGERVACDDGGHDAGVVIELLPNEMLLVGWDSGVRTPVHADSVYC